jgi:hypothetical protein
MRDAIAVRSEARIGEQLFEPRLVAQPLEQAVVTAETMSPPSRVSSTW